VLDLTLSQSELFANLSTNRKRQLKDWEKSLANIILEKDILTEFFLANYHDFYQSREATGVYNFSRDTLSFLASLDNVVIVGMRGPERVEAVTVFAYTPDVAEFLFNVSLPEGQRHSATLLWYGVNYLKSLKIPLLNLGGGIRRDDGVAQFKERFGAKKLALRCLKQVYEPEIYAKLCRQVNADPNNRTGYFPPYRRPDVLRIPSSR
jgi:lipid II:glycine glycyltransferase (peptidoglycan interpeptide bridge formation enzyme)